MPKMFMLQGMFGDGGLLNGMLVSYGAPQWWAPTGYAFGGVTFGGNLSFGYTNVSFATQGGAVFSLDVTTPASPTGDSTGIMTLVAQGNALGLAVGESLPIGGSESQIGGARPNQTRALVSGTFTRTA